MFVGYQRVAVGNVVTNLAGVLAVPSGTVRAQLQADLLDIRGIGPAKARRFGRETLGVIRRFVNHEGAAKARPHGNARAGKAARA